MSDKPSTEIDTQTAEVSDLENLATTPPMVSIDPFLGFRVDKKERDALFHRWFWRGAALSIISTIMIGANIHVALIVVWLSIALGLILLAIKQRLIESEKVSVADKKRLIKDSSAMLKNMAKMVAFGFGHGIGLLTISSFMHILIPIFKHILKI